MTLFLMTQIHNGNRSLIQASDFIRMSFRFFKLMTFYSGTHFGYAEVKIKVE